MDAIPKFIAIKKVGEMNFREGVKRIYLIFSFCVLLVPIAAYWDGFPTKERIDNETLWTVEADIASQIGIKSWEMPKIEESAAQFIGRYCSGKLVYTKPSLPDVNISQNAAICEAHKGKKDFFLVEQAKWVGMVVLVTALTAIGLIAAFLLSRWVLNGFLSKK